MSLFCFKLVYSGSEDLLCILKTTLLSHLLLFYSGFGVVFFFCLGFLVLGFFCCCFRFVFLEFVCGLVFVGGWLVLGVFFETSGTYSTSSF